MNKRIYLCLAHMSGKEQMYIKEAFDTNWVVPLGPNVNGFEKDLEEFVGEGKHVVALSAGTAAVHLALLACGVKPGDEVLVQSFTFCASSHPITYLGATPVFVDSEVDTWNMISRLASPSGQINAPPPLVVIILFPLNDNTPYFPNVPSIRPSYREDGENTESDCSRCLIWDAL